MPGKWNCEISDRWCVIGLGITLATAVVILFVILCLGYCCDKYRNGRQGRRSLSRLQQLQSLVRTAPIADANTQGTVHVVSMDFETIAPDKVSEIVEGTVCTGLQKSDAEVLEGIVAEV